MADATLPAIEDDVTDYFFTHQHAIQFALAWAEQRGVRYRVFRAPGMRNWAWCATPVACPEMAPSGEVA